MSAHREVTIFCDAIACGEWDERGCGDTAADARAGLRGLGWALDVPDPDRSHCRTRLDFCPKHAQEAPR